MRARKFLLRTNAECVCAEFFITLSGVIALLLPVKVIIPCFSLLLLKGASKAKIVSYLLMLLQIFFSEIFFQHFFSRASPSMPPRSKRQNGLLTYLCYEKNVMQQVVDIGLSSRVMCRILFFGSYCSHHT